jgi:hypothetical protein
MKDSRKKKCRCCRKDRPLAQFHRLEGTAAIHPFCQPCLAQKVRRRLAGRTARRADASRACAQCDQLLPVQMFHWLRASNSYHSYCRPCHAAYMAERYRRLAGGRKRA